MIFSWIVAWRYLTEGRMQSALTIGGTALGVAVMVFLSSLIDGLQINLIQQTLGTTAQVLVQMPDEAARPLWSRDAATPVLERLQQPAQRLRAIPDWKTALALTRGAPGLTDATPTLSGPAFAVRGSAVRAAVLKGVDPVSYDQVFGTRARIKEGVFDPDNDQAVIGLGLAQLLGVGVGGKIRLGTAANPGDTFTVSGIFDLKNADVNERWIFVSLRAAQTLLDLPGGVTAIEAQVADIFQADAVAGQVAARTRLRAESWMQRNRQLMVALRSQSSSSSMIQFFVILAVALGIASVLAVSVVQKSREIGILKAMGAQTGSVTNIFIIQGFLVGAIGALAGCAAGAGLSLFFQGLAVNADGSPTFPLLLTRELYLRSSLIAVATGVLASVLPARNAARLDPAVVIRYG